MKTNIRFFAIPCLCLASLGALSSCDMFLESDKQRIAMITDVGDIDDRSFNQGTWEGVVDYFKDKDYEFNRDYKYFRPITQSPADLISCIDDAITWGAEAIICPGFLFEPAVYQAQYLYPDVKFLIEDGTPHPMNDMTNIDIRENTLSVYFKEQESGFLAGYGAVYDGHRDLGFMGGMSVPAVKKFGAGYVAGAYYAAKELGLSDVIVKDNMFEYLGTFGPGAEVKSKATSWYKGGVDIIFTAAGGAGASVMSAAEEAKQMMIGVDVDQCLLSPSVLTSAKKNLGKAVEIFLDRFFTEWQGGEELHLGAEIDGVSLPTQLNEGTDPWRFKTFTKTQYQDIYQKIKEGTIIVPNDYIGLKTFTESLGFTLQVTQKTFDDK